VIAGSKGWGYEEFERTLVTLKHQERVTYLGYVSDQRRLSLLRNATVLAYPSVYEGFGLPPLEAMSEGVPVVATSVGSIPEVVGDAAVLVRPRDPVALAEAILRLLGDAEARANLIVKGLERVKIYNWAATASALGNLYAQIATA
jgi:glycosyltransferase involved in cell wall biosynthesis